MTKTKPAISAIVPVFNEEKTVAKVVKTLASSSLIGEVICINDCSKDKSLSALKKFGDRILLLDYKRNMGKGHALAEGIKRAGGEIVVFVDADLVNLSEGHLKTLLDPVLTGRARAVLGYCPQVKYLPSMWSELTGERVYYKKDLTPHLRKISKSRFGVEVYLNNLFKAKKVKTIPLRGLRGLLKHQKHGYKTAVYEYLNEGVEIALEIGKREMLTPEDKRIIKNLKKVTNLDELKKMIAKLYNKSIKRYLVRYVLRYLREIYSNRL